MDMLDRRIAMLKLFVEFWIAIALIYFFANLKAILMPEGLSDNTSLWTPLIGLGASLALTVATLAILLRRAAARGE
ncbi:MAG TPA: hypothetical protein VHP11_05860, partial [Tepidisphaeraceae bacterium]|nr:hypothetical protein [Tepidisphaeraceae bacterium]